MRIRIRPAAIITLSCGSFLLLLSLCQYQFAQGIGPPASVIHGDPATPVLVPDPAERFDAEQLIMKNNHPQERPDSLAETVCFLPPLIGIHSPTVGVGALANQAKASSEYEKACSAIGDKKFDSAEKHVRKALEKYPQYSALWVLLGQLQEKNELLPLARESCAHASEVSPTFAAAYLCLADIAAHAQDWVEVLKQSDRALALDPASSAVSYMFNAGANFNLHHFSAAEKNALRASQFAARNIDPRQLHYLLAEIYEAKGDLANEMAQLREFLKFSGNSKETEIVKQYLAKLSNAPGSSVTPPEHTAK